MPPSQPLDVLCDLFSTSGRRGLFDNAAAGLNVARLDGSFLLVNDGFCSFLGYTRDELPKLNVSQITHPDDDVLTRQYLDELVRDDYSGYIEKRYLRKDGTVLDGLLSASVVRDLQGTPQGFFALVQDITERKQAQSRLAESEQRYKSLFEHNYDAVFSLDGEGYFRTANPAAQRISGYSEEDLRQKSYVPLVSVDDLPRVRQAFIEAMRGEPQNLEISIIHKLGHRVHINLTTVPIIVHGHVEGMYGVAHDVTRRRISEQSLEESDERYRAFIENSSEAIWRFELELPISVDRSEEEQIEHFYRYCVLAECNDAMARMYGFERADEVIGQSLKQFLSPDNAANIEYLKAFIRSGYRLTNAESQEFDKNGTLRYFLNNLIGIVNNGLLQRAWGTKRDVTDSKRADELQKFLVGASAVLGTSLDYETTLRNVARLAVPFFADCCIVDIALGASVQRVAIAHRDPTKEEKVQEMRYHYPYNPQASIGVPKVLRTGNPELFSHISLSQLESAAQDESHLQILREVGLRSYICVPMVGRGQTVGAISFITAESGHHYTETDLALAQDIGRRAGIAVENAHLYQEAQQARQEAERERAAAELARLEAEAARVQAEAAQAEAEQANRAKDEFLAVVSHELRTPLTPILGWLHLLRSSKLSAPHTEQALETIERSARLQVQLVNDLLDVSRIVSGKLRLDIEPCDIDWTITDAVASVRGAANAKGVELKIMVDEVGQAECDGDRLQQIVWNLLSNAIKFSPEGGEVELRVQRQEPHLIIAVRDYGIGIEPAFLPYVFDRFRQADSATTRRHGGLGLGLAIVRHLVEMHGGTISVYSDGAGQGALFTVALPLRASASAMETAAASESGSSLITVNNEYSQSRNGDVSHHSENWQHESGASGADTEWNALPPQKLALSGARVDDKTLHGLRILVVDDESDARGMIAAVLAQSGASVVQASSAEQALSVLKHELPNLIISDIAMPDVDGYDFIQRVRRADERSRDIPAVALTARARSEDRQHSLDAGFQHHLCKPVDAADLVEAVAGLARQ